MKPLRQLILFLLALGAATVASLSLAGQTAQQGASRPVPLIRVDVDLVTVNASVLDPNDRPVTGLGPGNFKIWEDKVEQQIEYFSEESAPASVGIVFDVSGSMQKKIAASRDAAVAFLETGNPDDEYFLIEFSDAPRLTQDYTTDVARLRNHIIQTVANGKTAMYDAIYLGLEKLKLAHNPKRALLLITDGGDNHSRYNDSDIRKALKEEDVLIYTIGIGEEGYYLPEFGFYSPDRDALDRLAKSAGGQAFFPEEVEDLRPTCVVIAQQLKNQYVLGYKSSNTHSDGKWRKIRLKLNLPKELNGLGVRFKSGYFAAVR